MRLSRRAEYALLAMVDLANYSGERLVQLHDIARRQQIPEKYLEQLLRPLRASALIASTRGARGGYRLARTADAIRLVEVVEAIEGPIQAGNGCLGPASSAVHEVWRRVADSIRGELSEWSVQDLADLSRQGGSGDNWVI